MTSRVEHVALSGELDPVGSPGVLRAVRRAIRGGADAVVLHLEAVTFIDSSGLRALLGATDAADAAGVQLLILPGTQRVMDVVEAARLTGRLPFVGLP
ncbi:STAS domain-containing protein [Baekduia soli]|uniref:STAS domain-containing protein n=1 Tax=Baekduia soli TaxID=496014 RepID=UPI001651BC69|nr:STAS domain-containing protein [Baekduia soli]